MHASTLAVAQPTARELVTRAARAIGIGSLAGALAGLLWGAMARGAMRLIAREMRQFPSFSWQGTLMILVMGLILGCLAGIVYAGVRRMLPWRRWWRGLTMGVILVLTLGALIYAGPLVEEGNPQVKTLATLLFGTSLLIWGVLIELFYQPLDRRLLHGSHSPLVTQFMQIGLALVPICSIGLLVAGQMGVFE
jgi:hypothetical protein